jgi:D-alanine transaminase
VVLRLCDKAGLPHRQTPVFVEDLPRASELFMAGTTLEVMPVVQIDGRPVGDGAPGPVATKLQGMFRAAAVGRGSVDTDARAAVPRTQHEGGR